MIGPVVNVLQTVACTPADGEGGSPKTPRRKGRYRYHYEDHPMTGDEKYSDRLSLNLRSRRSIPKKAL